MTWQTTNWESTKTFSLLTRIFLASRRYANRVSYSATLLVMRNVNLMEHLNFSLSGYMSSIPAPTPSCADDPSTYTDQIFVSLSVTTCWPSISGIDYCPVSWNFWKEHSATKFASAWAFINFLGWNSKLYSLSLMLHLTIRQEVVILCWTSLRGWLVSTMMWWLWKYCLNFLEAINRE